MPGQGPVRATRRAGRADWPAAADQESPDDPRTLTPTDAADSAAAVQLPVPIEPAGGVPTPLPRWLTWLLRLMRSKLVRVGFLAVVLGLLAVALVDQAGTLWHQVQKLSAPVMFLALALSLAGLIGSLMVWRELLADLGSRLSIPEAWRIMFIGQLAKYVPGSIWPVIAQSELGADRGIPRSRSALSVFLGYAVMTCSGAVVAGVTLPFADGGSLARYFWVLFLIPVLIAVLSPPVLNPLLRLLLRLSRQPNAAQGRQLQRPRPHPGVGAGWLVVQRGHDLRADATAERRPFGHAAAVDRCLLALLGRRVCRRVRTCRGWSPRGGDGGGA